MGKFKMEGFKAFDMEKNSNNTPDGRAGSSVFQIAGKVYNKFSTSPNKIAKPERSNIGEAGQQIYQEKNQGVSMPPSLRRKEKSTSVGSKLVKKPVKKTVKPSSPPRVKVKNAVRYGAGKKSDSSDPFKIQTTTDKQRDIQRQGDYYRSDHQKKKDDRIAQMIRERNKEKQSPKKLKENADSPNKISSVVSKAPKIAGAIAKTISKAARKITGQKSTDYKDIMKKNNAYNIKEHQVKQPGGGMGTVITYQIKGQKGEYSISKNRLLENISKGKNK